MAAQKGSGNTGATLSFPEHLELLLLAAAILDAPKSHGTSNRHPANVSECIFEDQINDQDDIEADEGGVYDIANHELDVENPAEYLMYT